MSPRTMKPLRAALALLGLLGSTGLAFSCKELETAQKKLKSSPFTLYREATLYVDDTVAYREESRLDFKNGKVQVKTLKKEESKTASVKYNPDSPLPEFSCASFVQDSKRILNTEGIKELEGGKREIEFALKEGRLFPAQVIESGKVGILFFKKNIRFEVKYRQD